MVMKWRVVVEVETLDVERVIVGYSKLNTTEMRVKVVTRFG